MILVGRQSGGEGAYKGVGWVRLEFFVFLCFFVFVLGLNVIFIETRNFLPFSQCEWQELAIQESRDGACAVITILASHKAKAAQIEVEFNVDSHPFS